MYTRILVAIDSSTTAQKALNEAIRMAVALRASLCVAHALEMAALVQHGMGLGTYIDIEKVKGEMRDAGNRLLDQAVAKAAAGGCRAERLLLESAKDQRIAEMIADGARNWGADLTIVGTHGRHGFERVLLGSVAENLVRIAGNSLLLVREQ
jgi:nucleotide-binding universal stress UspA family protein